jgi:hypothetical protein
VTVPTSSRGRLGRVLVVGLAGGLLSGFFGVGGGIVMVPLILAVLDTDRHRAHATSLAAIFLIALSALIGYARAGNLDLGVGLALGAGGLVGSAAGAQLMHRMSATSLKVVFAVLLVATGARMLIW